MSDLTPLRAHYLKKSLVHLQFARELDLLAATDVPGVSNLSFLGHPFTPPPKGVPPVDLPFLKYIFRQFVLTFPFMDAAPKDFYSEKVQPFLDAMVSRNLSSSSLLDDGPTERATRQKLLAKVERNLAMFLGSATKIIEQEDVVRLSQNDLDRLQKLADRRKRRLAKNKDYFEVNIVGVRTVIDKGRVRSSAHEEFIIRTRRTGYHDIYVSRRYGDFRTLANELAKRYPEEDIRPPPAKDRSYVTAPQPPASAPPYTSAFNPTSPRPSNDGSPTSAASHQSWDGPDSTAAPRKAASRLAREKNRLTLRSYLHSLLASYTIASSPVLKSFLLQGFITLTPEEFEDAKRREEADRVREVGRKTFAKEIASRVDALREAVKSVKGDIMGKDGLTHVFGIIKVTPRIRDLPENYQAVVEWARMSLASTVFHTFVASDDASETFAGLKRIHGLMPYFMLKGALKITNPIAMIRSVLDLFLAQPFGGRSLLQRMFTSSLTEEVRLLEEEIALVMDKVDDPIMGAKIRQFVYAPREIQELFKADAQAEKMDVVVIVLRSAEQPVLSRAQMHRLARAHKAHKEWVGSRKGKGAVDGAEEDEDDDDDGPEDEDAWLIEDLRILTLLYQRLRDREQLIALIFEGFTSELLKDIITIFYSPLAQVYRAASIADSLNDLQNFVNDLIKTVEQVEELSQSDPQQTVQAFISLIQRHEHSFYNFVHKVHSKGEGLFDSLMRWIELFLTVIREGLGVGPDGTPSLSLEYLLPHTNTAERAQILAEVDSVAMYHYKLKVLYEEKLRRRFGRAQPGGVGGDADEEDEAAQALVNGVVGEIAFGDLVKGAAIDLAAEDTDEEGEGSTDDDDDSGSSEYESGSGSSDSGESSSEETETEENGVAEDRRRVSLAKQKQKQRNSPASPAPHRVTPPAQSQKATSKTTPLPPQVQPAGKASASSASLASGAAPNAAKSAPPQPPRKRSLSLRSMRSMTFSFKKGQEGKGPTPPVPPMPSSMRSNGDGSGAVSSMPASPAAGSPRSGAFSTSSSRASMSRDSSRGAMRSQTMPMAPPPTPVYPARPAVKPIATNHLASESSPTVASPVPISAPTRVIPPLPSSNSSGASAASSSASSSASPSPSPTLSTSTASSDATQQQPRQAQAKAPKPSEKILKAKKKKQQVEALKPPELTHIPQLLPVFVEMMRPLLRPRKRTADDAN